jgi:hypothetical protein
MIEFFALKDRDQPKGTGQRGAALSLLALCPGSGRSDGARGALQQSSTLRAEHHDCITLLRPSVENCQGSEFKTNIQFQKGGHLLYCLQPLRLGWVPFQA